MNIKIKYTKGEAVKYISHLDLMRTIQRAIRRAEIPVAYSQGFNPHLKVSFGQALKVGQTSAGEEAVLQIEGEITPQELKNRLNSTLPSGIEILDAVMI